MNSEFMSTNPNFRDHYKSVDGGMRRQMPQTEAPNIDILNYPHTQTEEELRAQSENSSTYSWLIITLVVIVIVLIIVIVWYVLRQNDAIENVPQNVVQQPQTASPPNHQTHQNMNQAIIDDLKNQIIRQNEMIQNLQRNGNMVRQHNTTNLNSKEHDEILENLKTQQGIREARMREYANRRTENNINQEVEEIIMQDQDEGFRDDEFVEVGENVFENEESLDRMSVSDEENDLEEYRNAFVESELADWKNEI